jgi:ribose transport system permease protein
VGEFWVQAFLGLILLAAVALDRLRAGSPCGGGARPPDMPARALLANDWAGLLLLVLVGGAALAAAHPAFLSGFNLYVLLVSFSLTALVAMAQMVIVAIGQMNLSVGAIGGLAAIAFAGGMEVWGLPPALALLLGLGLGLGCGLLNGWLIRLTGINAFVITLATLYIFKGAVTGSARRSRSTAWTRA